MNFTKKEVTVILSRCQRSKQLFGIRTEKIREGEWLCNWAFRMDERTAAHEGYGAIPVSGRMPFDAEYPGCPYCGATGWFTCGKCGRVTCYANETMTTCGWCGNTAACAPAETFALKGTGY